MAAKFTLGKQERLKSRKVIEQVFSEGKKFNAGLLRAHYLPGKASQPLSFGVAVSSRIFSSAVDRNRIKRLIREAYRLQKLSLQKNLLERAMHLDVFVVYTGKQLPEYEEIYQNMQKLLLQLSKTLNPQR